MITRLFIFTTFGAILNGIALADQPKINPEKVQLAKDLAQSNSNLKEIGLAFHQFYDAHGHCLNNIANAKGILLLSWRVQLLPYLKEDDLFKQFKQDEPWDSTHNKKLVGKLPNIFAPVRGKAGMGETFYRGFTGASTIFEANKMLHFQDITDGMSNTFLCVEADKSCPWTKPDDLPFDPMKAGLPKLGGTMFADGFHAVFCDGSVQFIKKDIAKETLKALITRDGGEVVQFP